MICKQIFNLHLFYNLILICGSSAAILIENPNQTSNDIDKDTAKCINEIMRNVVPCYSVLTLFHSKSDVDCLIKTISSDICYTVVVRSTSDINQLHSTAYIAIVDSEENLAESILMASQNILWDPQAPFIVYSHYSLNQNKVFAILLSYKVFKAVFIKSNGCDKEIFTYLPFENYTCGRSFEDPIKIANCPNITNINGYLSKINFKNCTILATIAEDPPNIIYKRDGSDTHVTGLEIYILETIADIEDVSIKYDLHPRHAYYGMVLPNYTATGLMGYLQNNSADIIAGGYAFTKNRADKFYYTNRYNYVNLYLYTPAAEDTPWNKLHEEFDVTTWSLLALSLLIMLALCSVIIKMFRYNYDFTNLLLKLYSFFLLGNSNTSLLQKHNLRPFLASWIWLSFFVTNFYTTALYSLVTAKVRHTQYVENVNDLPFKACVNDNYREVCENEFNMILPVNAPDLSECNTPYTLDVVASRTDLFTIRNEYSYLLDLYKYIDDEGKSKLDVWDLHIHTAITMYISRGFPLFNQFKHHTTHLIESGLLSHRLNEILRPTNIAINRKNIRRVKKIRLVDFKNHFFVLILGVIISTICFMLEFYV
jgi:hypothetical protein